MRSTDVAWVAGIVEGEGCITWNTGGLNKVTGERYGTPNVQMSMSDKDVVARVANILKSNLKGPYDKGLGNKPQWFTCAGGQKAASWLMTLYPFLGERRRAKAAEVLALWRASGPTRGKYSSKCIRGHDYDGHRNGQRTCSECASIRNTNRDMALVSV